MMPDCNLSSSGRLRHYRKILALRSKTMALDVKFTTTYGLIEHLDMSLMWRAPARNFRDLSKLRFCRYWSNSGDVQAKLESTLETARLFECDGPR